ncbi:restriction endonuclease [Xylanibacter ruminicola]|uniref:restriction endonuclease n=1 Tax=Xylanibacter ruminicola TaxID=839 RepID=UPI00048BC254|nr:restriction endonuclease [Xylanibacter ruminicola]
MAIPKFQDFLFPFLTLLKDSDKSNKEIKDNLIKHFSLTDEDCLIKTKGGVAFQVDDRIGWCRQWLRRALFIEIPQKGIYRITQRGLDYLKSHSDLRESDLMEYPEYAEYAKPSLYKSITSKSDSEAKSEELTPTEQLESAIKVINDDLSADILQKAREMSPAKFEQLVLDLLLAMGYGGSNKDLAKVTPISHDNGVDGIIPEDALGLDKIYIQAKRYKEGIPVHKPEIQQFIGALNEQKASKGVFVTTSTFTQGARESVNNATSKIVLIDGKALAQYMIEFNVGVSTRKTYEVKRLDTDYFEE